MLHQSTRVNSGLNRGEKKNTTSACFALPPNSRVCVCVDVFFLQVCSALFLRGQDENESRSNCTVVGAKNSHDYKFRSAGTQPQQPPLRSKVGVFFLEK